MSDNSQQKRRDFLKTAAMGAVGAAGLGALKFDSAHAQTTGGWVNGTQVNPAIDNKRVISCHDPKMLNSTPANNSFTTTNAAVNAAVVAANLDQMAMLLAGKSSATEAWSTIFRSGKPWASTRVAMKTNGIGSSNTNRPKWAIYKKLCDVLVGLGVKPANIVLYDNCDNAATYYDAFTSLTDATKIQAAPTSVRAAALGGFKAVTLTSTTGISCAADLVDGNIDILVNVAACKSHNGTGGKYSYGSVTLCMKNHFGTFTDGTKAQYSNNLHVGNSGATPPPPLALFEINKHPAVMGGSPVRQQLCIVDALLSNGASGPGGGWDNRTDRLVMGTFAPIVDYLSAKNILLDTAIMTSSAMPALGVTNAAIILPLFLSSFGYSEATISPWIEYNPATGIPDAGAGGSGTSGTGGNTGSGGGSGSGGAGSGGGNGTGGRTGGSGGASGSGGSRSGGASGSGGSGSGGSGSGGSGSGGSGSGGFGSGGSGSGGSGSGGSGSGGSGSGGSGSGGMTTAGGTPAGSGGSASRGGSSTSVSSASGGAAAMGGSSAGTGAANTAAGCACDLGGLGRKASPWAAVLGLGAVVAGRLRRLVIGGGDSAPKPPSNDDNA